MLMTYGNVLLIWAHSVPVAMEIGWLVAASLVFFLLACFFAGGVVMKRFFSSSLLFLIFFFNLFLLLQTCQDDDPIMFDISVLDTETTAWRSGIVRYKLAHRLRGTGCHITITN